MKNILLATLTSPLVHNDPAIQTDSNTIQFNRAKIKALRTAAQRVHLEASLIAGLFPVPNDIASFCEQINIIEFSAIALLKLFMDSYNSHEGSGLFSGKERYARLESRMSIAAEKSKSILDFWNNLLGLMQCDSGPTSHDGKILKTIEIINPASATVLHTMIAQRQSIIAVARQWHSLDKMQNERYAEKAGMAELISYGTVIMNFADYSEQNEYEYIEVPEYQGNALRSVTVRKPSKRLLFEMLGFTEADIYGNGELLPGVEAIFDNGGNLAKGAKAGGNPILLSSKIRNNYPSLDLLGGCTDNFDIGESRLKCGCMLVCRENRPYLGEYAELPGASISCYEMLTEITQTRTASESGQGQMIYNFEALATGAQFILKYMLTPFTKELTKGALSAALEYWQRHGATLGGMSRVGFGNVEIKPIKLMDGWAEASDAYLGFIETNKEQLRAWLCDGTLGSGAKVFDAK